MKIALYGLNHKSAPLSLRETIAVSGERLEAALQAAKNSLPVEELVILSTCNRTEFYCHFTDSLPTAERRRQLNIWLAKMHKLPVETLESATYYYEEDAAVAHMIRVAAGMDSMIIGEPEIMGQVKLAWRLAADANSIDQTLDNVSQYTLRYAKRIRTTTGISEGPVSLAFAALKLARRIFDELANCQILLVGAGEMIKLIADHLIAAKPKHMIIANRNFARAQALASEYNAAAITIGDLKAALCESDIVITATDSPVPLIGKGMTEAALTQRKHRPMLMLDLAVPRDIEPEAGELADVYLYQLDDLQGIIDENSEQRRAAQADGERIVTEAREGYLNRIKMRAAVPLIQMLRRNAKTASSDSLKKAKAAIDSGDDPKRALEDLAHNLTNQLLHQQIMRIKQAAEDGDTHMLDAAYELHESVADKKPCTDQ